MRACVLRQMGANMNDVVGDHSESDPASHAVRSFIYGPAYGRERGIGATHAGV